MSAEHSGLFSRVSPAADLMVCGNEDLFECVVVDKPMHVSAVIHRLDLLTRCRIVESDKASVCAARSHQPITIG